MVIYALVAESLGEPGRHEIVHVAYDYEDFGFDPSNLSPHFTLPLTEIVANKAQAIDLKRVLSQRDVNGRGKYYVTTSSTPTIGVRVGWTPAPLPQVLTIQQLAKGLV